MTKRSSGAVFPTRKPHERVRARFLHMHDLIVQKNAACSNDLNLNKLSKNERLNIFDDRGERPSKKGLIFLYWEETLDARGLQYM